MHPKHEIKPIPFLKPGDTVHIVSPAKALPEKSIESAISILKSWKLNIKLGKHVYNKYGGFAGNDLERLVDVQAAINDNETKAIFFARGGYGSVRVLHQLNWEKFIQNPKWLIGFSDITYFHLFVNWQLNLPTIHGTMPLEITYEPERQKSSETLKNMLFGEVRSWIFNWHAINIIGVASGKIIGGNLTVLHGYLVGRDASAFFKDKILFIEDVGEELYALDRMLWNLKSSGILQNLNAVLVGGFTNIKDTNHWFVTNTLETLALHVFKPLKIPVAFGIEAGHIKNNTPIVLNTEVQVEISSINTKITYL